MNPAQDPSLAISESLGDALKTLEYKNRKITIYDFSAPDDAEPPYVIVGPWLSQDRSSKGRFQESGEITLDVVTRFTGGAFSKRPANEIANLILATILPYVGAKVLTVRGFSCWNVSKGAPQELMLQSATDIVFRKLLTINLSLTQL